MRRMPGYERYQILQRASQLMAERNEKLGRLISTEEGKTLADGLFEARRAIETIGTLGRRSQTPGGRSAAARRCFGGRRQLGFTLRIPCGVVVAITPFNFPLNLVTHKVGPALAAGNAVILKPASDTPLSALALVEILLEAGLASLGHFVPDRFGRRDRRCFWHRPARAARSASPAVATSASTFASGPD